jgi:hypothetical protein
MPAALTPAQALGYLRELSADITAAIVLDARGALLAGPPALHGPARALLAHARASTAELHGRTPAGAVFAARDEHHQIVVTTGPLALPRLTRHDLRTALATLGNHGAIPETTPLAAPERLVEPLLTAAQGRL